MLHRWNSSAGQERLEMRMMVVICDDKRIGVQIPDGFDIRYLNLIASGIAAMVGCSDNNWESVFPASDWDCECRWDSRQDCWEIWD